MIHIQLSPENVIDLELENHSNINHFDFIGYIDRWLQCEEIKSKHGKVMRVNPDELIIFCDELLNGYYFQNFILYYYGDQVRALINDRLRGNNYGPNEFYKTKD